MNGHTMGCMGKPEVPEPDYVRLASLVNAMNKAYCQWLSGQAPQMTHEEKASSIEGLEKIYRKGFFHPRDLHDSWMGRKLRLGWRFGESKSEEDKTHPCLLPFSDLPAEEQFKDLLFGTVAMFFIFDRHR